MKKKIYLFITLLTILCVVQLNLARNRIKDVRYILFFGNEKQKEKMYTPLVEEKFDFSKLGKKTYKIFPYYFGWYTVRVRITNDISTNIDEVERNYPYLINCIRIKIYVEDEVIYEKVLKDDSFRGYTAKTSMGLTLAYFEIKEEYLDKKIITEIEVIDTNENLIKYINEKTILVEVGINL